MTLVRKNRMGSSFPTRSRNFFGDTIFDTDLWDDSVSTPPANVTETKEEFRVDLSAPGLDKTDFKVEVEDDALVVRCEKEEEEEEEDEDYKRREFSYRSFYRSFPLPENVSEEKIKAKYENGMLQISIPKKEIGMTRSKKAIEVA